MPLYSKDSQICRSCWWPLSCNGNNCWQYDTRLLNASPLLPLFSAKLLYVFSKGQFDSSDLSLFTPLLIFWHFQTCWTTLVTAFGIFLEAHFWSVVLGVVFLGMHRDRELLGYILQPTVLDRVQGYKRMDLEGRGGLRRNKCPFLCGSSLTLLLGLQENVRKDLSAQFLQSRSIAFENVRHLLLTDAVQSMWQSSRQAASGVCFPLSL